LRKRGYGHYTDGIYATTFFIRDIGNFNAQQFNHAFKQRFGREPDDLAATSYDAAAIAVEAIKGAKPGSDLALSRKRIRSQLTTFSNIETGAFQKSRTTHWPRKLTKKIDHSIGSSGLPYNKIVA